MSESCGKQTTQSHVAADLLVRGRRKGHQSRHVRQSRRSSGAPNGFSLAEVAISSFLVIFFTILALDLALMIFACSVNDKACLDAVRAAAQQPTAAQSAQFALAEVKNHKTDGFFISQIKLVGSTVNYQDFGGTPPAGQTPYVQATTNVSVLLPLPLYFFGDSLTNNFQFTQTYTSPIIRTKYAFN
jgi:hypothetical protein